MSWCFPPSLCRIIALLLLVLDLGQEPGSALLLTSLVPADDEAVNEICTRENFWWGVATTDECLTLSRQAASSAQLGNLAPPVSTICAVTANQDERILAGIPIADERSCFDSVLISYTHTKRSFDVFPNRNSYLGHQRSVVLVL